MGQYSEERLSKARAESVAALDELDRQELAETLCEQDRLMVASLTEDTLGPLLVTYQHRPLGEVRTTSPSAFKDWYAQPYQEDGSLGADSGPFTTARAAAASLIPGRDSPEPEPHGAG